MFYGDLITFGCCPRGRGLAAKIRAIFADASRIQWPTERDAVGPQLVPEPREETGHASIQTRAGRGLFPLLRIFAAPNGIRSAG